ncbi:hypothetical protein B484DRAFT_390840, partial [Ochromonadaceae sp. CCMP2298]
MKAQMTADGKIKARLNIKSMVPYWFLALGAEGLAVGLAKEGRVSAEEGWVSAEEGRVSAEEGLARAAARARADLDDLTDRVAALCGGADGDMYDTEQDSITRVWRAGILPPFLSCLHLAGTSKTAVQQRLKIRWDKSITKAQNAGVDTTSSVKGFRELLAGP